jgi:hypothetical protein
MGRRWGSGRLVPPLAHAGRSIMLSWEFVGNSGTKCQETNDAALPDLPPENVLSKETSEREIFLK